MNEFFDELFSDYKAKTATQAVTVKVEKTVQNEALGETTRTATSVKEEIKTIPVPLSSGPSSYVAVEMGATVNLGNFSTAKIKISLFTPVGKEITPEVSSELEETFSFAKAWVEKKLDAEMKGVLALQGKV